jgi:hypothetical protein
MSPFSVGAIVMVQRVDINRTTVVKKYVRQVSAIQADQRVDLTTTTGWLTSSDVGIFEVGDEVCTIGHVSDTALDSSIYLSATDADNPFLRVFDGVDTYGKWSLGDKSTIKLQLGNLASLASYDIVPASPGYGLYSDNVFLKGLIQATSGLVGGFTINSTEGLYAGTGATRVQMKPGAGFWAGATAFADAPFNVSQAGALKATSGLIGGWSIATDAIYTGTKQTGDDYSTSGITMANNGGLHAKNFYVNSDGEVGVKQIVYEYQGVSSDLIQSHDDEVNQSSASYTLAKTITLGSYVKSNRTIRIKFSLKAALSGYAVYGKIYRGAVAVGSERSTSSDAAYTEYSEDIINWNAGEAINLYIHGDGNGLHQCYAANFRIYGSHSVVVNEITGTNS